MKKNSQQPSLSLATSPYIQDIDRGLLEEGHFLVKKLNLNIGRNNKPFLRLLLADKTGHMPAIFFDERKKLENIHAQLTEGDIVKVAGIIEDYQDVLQLKLLKIEKTEKPLFELSRFWKRTPKDRREMYKSLKTYINQIQTPELKKLCMSFLKDRDFMKLFLEAPASRYVHHAYIGGLLEHTLNVVNLCKFYSQLYEETDHDLLITGAFIHNIGKIDEYEFLFHIDHSLAGKLKGHAVLGYDRLNRHMSKVKLSELLQLKLQHIMLSHQGKRHWGAVEEPRFLEAYLVHSADSTDSSRFIFANAQRKKSRLEGANTQQQFSEYVTQLGREIFLG